MIIVKNLNIGNINYVYKIHQGWVIENHYSIYDRKPHFVIRPDGTFDEVWENYNKSGLQVFQDKNGETIYLDENGNVTYDSKRKTTRLNQSAINYSYQLIGPNTIISQHLGFKKEEVGAVFKNLKNETTKLILINPEIINTGESDEYIIEYGYPLKVVFSHDEQTVLIYQDKSNNGKVLIMDNPVFD